RIRHHAERIPFPYTTLFRSRVAVRADEAAAVVSGVGRGLVSEYQRLPQLARVAVVALELCDEVVRRLAGRRRAVVAAGAGAGSRSEEHTSELQSRERLVCRL